MSTKTRLTLLNSMADRDFDRALDQHAAWNLELLDLKDCAFTASRSRNSTLDEAGRASEAIGGYAGFQSIVFRRSLFFRRDGSRRSRIPQAPSSSAGRGTRHSADSQAATHSSVAAQSETPQGTLSTRSVTLRRAADVAPAASTWKRSSKFMRLDFKTVIENEIANSIFSTPKEIVEFFKAYWGCAAKCRLRGTSPISGRWVRFQRWKFIRNSRK